MHFKCSSIKSLQFSAPFSDMHSSLALRVSGQAQHGLHLGFSVPVVCVGTSGEVGCVLEVCPILKRAIYVEFT